MLIRFLHRRRLKFPIFPTYCSPHLAIIPRQPFSSLSSAQTQEPEPIPKPSSLSARMSFVFDQIDAIEKERSQKDQTLQRIRAWRESKKQSSKEEINPVTVESNVSEKKLQEFELTRKDEVAENVGLLDSKREVELVHPWPEWIELMERLVQQNYFDHKRKDEEGMIENLGFNLAETFEEDGFDFTRDFKTVQTAVLNFGKDRFDIMRSLSRQDLQILVGYGCASDDKKVVFSSKLLRKHVHLDEGDVCSSCSLRSTCERAYLITNKEDEARTIDVMRVLLAYGFDVVNGSVTNKSLLKKKSLKNVVRKLIHDVVKLSAVPIDPNLPPPVIKRPPPKVKQPPPPPKKRVGRDDVEMKKGDWLCMKCDFMNFAKNTVCLQCDANRPKRQLLPGEWECPQCNFLNYRRNTICFHCEHKRPPEEFVENPVQERQQSLRRMEKISGRPEVPNAWNFDFDDNESDGADVAAFEYADSKNMKDGFILDKQAHGGIAGGRDDGFHKGSRPPRLSERGYSDAGPSKPGLGFDDFDDDDLDSYELDTQNVAQKTSAVNFSELEADSSTEDDVPMNHDWSSRRKSNVRTQNKQSDLFSDNEDRIVHNRNVPQRSNYRTQNKPLSSRRQVGGFSGSDSEIDFGSDDDLPINPNWKSSHANQKSKRRGSKSFGSGDDELSSDSDYIEEDEFGSRQKNGNKWSSGKSSRKQQRLYSEDEEFSDMGSKNSGHFNRKSFNSGKSGGINGRGKTSNGGMDRKRNPRRDSFPPSSSSGGKSFEDGWRKNPRNGDSKNLRRSPRREGSSYKPRQDRHGSSSYKQGGDSYLDDERFQRPRVNVR